jgi:hypothetical protein
VVGVVALPPAVAAAARSNWDEIWHPLVALDPYSDQK